MKPLDALFYTFHRYCKMREKMKNLLLLAIIGTLAAIVEAQTQEGTYMNNDFLI